LLSVFLQLAKVPEFRVPILFHKPKHQNGEQPKLCVLQQPFITTVKGFVLSAVYVEAVMYSYEL